ncbi:MAG: hypothetical protein II793_04620, partial [Bacteroidales bacterium]|nr:hypothetical protein [Bacteroidales bacterium]
MVIFVWRFAFQASLKKIRETFYVGVEVRQNLNCKQEKSTDTVNVFLSFLQLFLEILPISTRKEKQKRFYN